MEAQRFPLTQLEQFFQTLHAAVLAAAPASAARLPDGVVSHSSVSSNHDGARGSTTVVEGPNVPAAETSREDPDAAAPADAHRDFLEFNDAYHVVTAQVRQKAALPVPSGLLAAVPCIRACARDAPVSNARCHGVSVTGDGT